MRKLIIVVNTEDDAAAQDALTAAVAATTAPVVQSRVEPLQAVERLQIVREGRGAE